MQIGGYDMDLMNTVSEYATLLFYPVVLAWIVFTTIHHKQRKKEIDEVIEKGMNKASQIMWEGVEKRNKKLIENAVDKGVSVLDEEITKEYIQKVVRDTLNERK